MTVEAVSVGELVRRRTGRLPDPWELALVQRDIKWDEVRMGRLLDSLLAGYPIGALLVCRVRQGAMVIVQTEDGREARAASDETTQLIDGQQRVNALVSLFSDAGTFGRFFLDMTAKRPEGDVVTRRRDKRIAGRYIHWSSDGTFVDGRPEVDESERRRFLDLSRIAAWADRVGDPGVAAALERVTADDAAAIEVLREIDPYFGRDVPPATTGIVADRLERLLQLWRADSIPVQHLVLDEPSDVLQVFTRINLEGVQVAGEDVFFAGVKTRWPAAEQTLHRVSRDVPIVSRLGALRVLVRLASVQVAQGDLLPLRVDALNKERGQRVIEGLEALTSGGPELPRVRTLAELLVEESGLGFGLHLVHAELFDHVLAWAAVNPRADDRGWLHEQLSSISTYLIGATAYRYPTVFRDTFLRLAFREALAAGHAGEAFPVEPIVAATRRQWPELRAGQRAVTPGELDVNANARLFLSIVQRLPFRLPLGREVEWDHIYPQALANRMRWRGPDGDQRLQHHPKRGFVWHGANLWALDAPINLVASDEWPSAKFAFLGSLPLPDRRLPALWPDEGFLSEQERAELQEAERLIREDQVDAGMEHFERYVVGRADRIREEILGRFPAVASFAADAPIDPYAFEDRHLPPGIVRVPLALEPFAPTVGCDTLIWPHLGQQ